MVKIVYSISIMVTLLLGACAGSSDSTTPMEASGVCETGAIEPLQAITIDTAPVKAASCTLKNDKGEWLITTTPGVASVARSRAPLNVSCIKPGYLQAEQKLDSISKDNSAINLISTNILGAGDEKTEIAYDYPGLSTLTLKPMQSPTTTPLP